MSERLKPCPFCGSEATIAMYPLVGAGLSIYTVECMNFECPNPDLTSECYLTEEAAAKAWNHRRDGESHDD